MSEYARIMDRLYGENIWNGFEPRPTPDEVHGWNGNNPTLERLAATPGPKVVVDVGVWKGQSTITMANAMKRAGIDGVIVAVDTFLGSREHFFERRYFDRRHGLPDLYATFLSNVHRAGVTEYVIPMAQTSSTAARLLKLIDVRPHVVHVDAAHEYREAISDIEDYWDILASGGYLIGDDYHETWPGVVQAAGEFSARVMRPLAVELPKFIIQKP